MRHLKKHLVPIILTVILLIPFLFLQDLMRPLTAVITRGMSNRDGRRVTMFIVCIPVIVCYLLIDFIKRRYFDKSK